MTSRAGSRRGKGARRAGAVTAAAAALAAAVALAASGCSAGAVQVGATPPAGPPQPGSVQSASPAPSQGASSGTPACHPTALSPRPTAGDAAGPNVQRIKNRGYLIVGVAQDGYLTGYLDSFGQETGFDIDIARQVEQALFGTQDGKHIRYVAVTNQQRIDYLQGPDPRVDIVVDTFTITCDRAKKVLFSTDYYDGTQRVLVTKGSGYRSLDDLGGKKVCAQTNSTSLQAVAAYKSHPVPYGVKNLTDCLVALQQGQVDAISTDDTILAGLARQDPNTEVLPQIVEKEPYGIAASTNARDLIQFVNGVLEQIRPNTWGTIYRQWLEPALGTAQPPAAAYAG